MKINHLLPHKGLAQGLLYPDYRAFTFHTET